MSPASSKALTDETGAHSNGSAGANEDDSRSAGRPDTDGERSDTSGERDQQWDRLQAAILRRAKERSTEQLFGEATNGGAVYRWGIAASLDQACDELTIALSRLAVDQPLRGKRASAIDLATASEEFLDSVSGSSLATLQESAEAILWAASMPALSRILDARCWWDLLGGLQELRESALRNAEPCSPSRLLLGGELGLTLGWRLADLPSCRRLGKSSHEALAAWFEQEADSIAAAVSGVLDSRLVLASLIRCRRLIEGTTKRKLKKRQVEIAADLATWVAGMTLPGGTTAFGKADRRDVRDDLGPLGLLQQSVEFDNQTLRPAISAALGASHSGGRLAWEVCLPEAMLSCDDAKLAILLPDWDVRRGRVHLDYCGEEVLLELFGGKPRLLSGHWEVQIDFRGEQQAPCSPWTQTCEYTDDDVHYIELEQEWTGDLVLQRQVMQLRDDRCLLFADAVLSEEPSPAAIRYTGRFSLSPTIEVDSEPETRDLFLTAGKKRRAMLMPLAAAEWRVGPTAATLAAEEGQIVYTARGEGRLYAPLWIDLQSRRFDRQRTWRQLTIGDELRIVPANEAAAYRVQVGSEQWMLYRSLGQARCRTVLGKHLLADFLCTRFDMGDGSHEDLITVDVPDANE